jgi:hypothetical protein
MQKNAESYYQPYMSDSEDSSSITSSDTSDTEDSMTDDPIGSKKFLTQVGGINLDPVDKQIGLRIQPKVKRGGVEYSEFDLSGVKDDGLGFTGTKFDMANGTYTTILMINSRDRDSQVYPQPTFFTIRLPRTYRNITSFQITQMKLLSSFFYFRNDKGNTTMDVLEQGRTITDNGTTVDNIITVRIREGTYNIDSLLSELQTQMNRTPLFFYYPNGFSDFITQFTAAGDLSVNFNQPGDNFYNTLTDQFIQNPTVEQIVTTFFATRYAGLSIYTLAQVKVAYYYPVLYEMILDPEFAGQLNLTLSSSGPQLLPGETVKSRIVYTFQGLNDGVIQEIIDNNLKILTKPGVSILDNYRSLHTFVYSLVNEYSCSYEQNNNRVIISTSRLNTSLFNLLNQQAALSLVDTLNSYGLTLAQYSNLLLSNTLYTAVFTNMYNFMQSNFATNFAVDFGTYTPVFYTNVSNAPYLQNGIGAVGVATGYSLAVLSSGNEPINSSTQNLRSFPVYWPQITSTPSSDVSGNVMFIGSGLQNRAQDISADFMNVVYNTLGGNMQTNQKLIDNSGNIFINPTFGAGDCVTPILNSQYTVFRFRSYVRQTLQVETLPLPYYYRFPTVNLRQFNPPIPSYFDASYSYVNSPYLTRTDISSVSVTFPQPYTTAYSAAKDYQFTVNNSRRFYTFVAPRPKARTGLNPPLTDASGYKYPLTVSIVANSILGTPIPSPSIMNAYFYHDQGGFYADVSANRNENPYHYKEFAQLTTDVSSVSFTTNVYAGNQYYMIVRSSNVSFQDTRLKVLAYYPNQYSTPIARFQFQQSIDPYSTPTTSFPVTSDVSYNQIYAIQYDRDFIRLPTASNLMGADPSSQGFNKFLPVSEVAIGYDVSGVSTDLTDYKGYTSNVLGNVPFATVRADPVSQYNFQVLSPYNTQTSNYFYSGSSNALLAPRNNKPYTAKRVPNRQFKIVNWYDTQYIPPQANQRGIPNSNFVAKSRVLDASYGSLIGYVYDSSGNPGGSTSGMTLDRGVIGFGFLPQEGVWDVEEVVFKTAYMERPLLTSNFTNPNKNIKYLGVFPTSYVSGVQLSDISLNEAIYKLDASGVYTYTPDVQALNNTFDNVGGTYFRFVKNTSFTTTNRVKLAGYTPTNDYLFDSNSYYSVVGFDLSQSVVPFYTLMGSYIPYPAVSYPIVTTGTGSSNLPRTPDGKQYYTPRNLSAVNPAYFPVGTYNQNYYPSDSNIKQSKYELSMPIKTNVLHSQALTNPNSFSNGFYYYSMNPDLSYNPVPFGVRNMITMQSKGPYIITLSDRYTGPLTLGSNETYLYLASNQNFASTLSGQSVRTFSNMFPSNPYSINQSARGIEYTPLYPGQYGWLCGMPITSSGASDLSGIYGVTLDSANTDTLNPTFFNFVVSRISFDAALPGKEFRFNRFNYISNAIPYSNGAQTDSNTVFTTSGLRVHLDYDYLKTFYIERANSNYNTTIIQYNASNNVANLGTTYLSIYNPANGITNFNTISTFTQSDYYWNNVEQYTDPLTSNFFFDMTADTKGNLYFLKQTGGPASFFTITKYLMDSNGYVNWSTPVTISADLGQNQSVYSLYGTGRFNQIKVDETFNIYLQQQIPQNWTFGAFEYPYYLTSNWSIPLIGRFATVNSQYNSEIPGANITNTVLQVSRQNFQATSNDREFSEGFPLISSDMLLGLRKGTGTTQPFFSQMSSKQGFYFEENEVTIQGVTPSQADISGNYGIAMTSVQYGITTGVFLLPTYTQAQVQAAFTQVLTNVSPPGVTLSASITPITFSAGTQRLSYKIFISQGFNVSQKTNNLYSAASPSTALSLSVTQPVSRGAVEMQYPPLWGNSQFGIDLLPFTVNNSWQVFYPTTKIVLKKLQNGFTPITDTTDLTTYPSYEHTAMFYYDNYKDLSNDIFNKFGQENKARFKAYDISSGYYFNSYIFNIQLQPFKGNSRDVSSNNGYNFLAVRGYSPCETFNCLTRFYLPGRYDFGFIALKDLSNETQSVLVDLSGSSLVNPTYAFVLNQFNNAFKGNFRFGSNAVPGFSGSNYTFTGFGSFLNQYIKNYNSGTSNANLLAAITSNVNSNVANYIQTYLSAILPSYVLNRERFTDPLLFSMLLKSGLSDARKDLEYEWGLGWNLGFPKVDTPYDTIQRATSFFKILDDYIYLRLNQEFWMNRLDSSGKENLSITHESQGQTNQFAAKLLLANFGSYAQTMIQNPITFNPVLTSIDRLSFEWVDLTGARINNLDCEWNAAVQIVEQVTQATPNSTIPRAEAPK